MNAEPTSASSAKPIPLSGSVSEIRKAIPAAAAVTPRVEKQPSMQRTASGRPGLLSRASNASINAPIHTTG